MAEKAVEEDSLANSPKAVISRYGPSQTRSKTSILVSHMGGMGQGNWAVLCFLPRLIDRKLG